MKLIYKILGAGLVAGALLMAGCAAEKKSAPDFDANATTNEKATAQYAVGTAFNMLISGPSSGTGYVITFDSATSTLSGTFDNLQIDDNEFITGEITIKIVSEDVLKLSGNVSLSGDLDGTVVFSWTDTVNGSTETVKGTITVNGTKYSINQTGSVSTSVLSKAKKLGLKPFHN